MGHLWLQCFLGGRDPSSFSHVAAAPCRPLPGCRGLKKSGIYPGDTLVAFLQSPIGTHPLLIWIHEHSWLFGQESVHTPESKGKGGDTGRAGWERPPTIFCHLLSTYCGTRSSVNGANTEPNPALLELMCSVYLSLRTCTLLPSHRKCCLVIYLYLRRVCILIWML